MYEENGFFCFQLFFPATHLITPILPVLLLGHIPKGNNCLFSLTDSATKVIMFPGECDGKPLAPVHPS